MSLGNFAYGGGQRSYSFPHVFIGRLPNSLTPVQMPGIPSEQIAFFAHPDNTENVYLGTSAVMSPSENLPIEAGKWSAYMPVQNLDNFWYYCGDNASYIHYVVFW